MFCKNGALKNFPKFTGNYLCQSLVLNKVAGTPFSQNTTGSLLCKNYESVICKVLNAKTFFVIQMPKTFRESYFMMIQKFLEHENVYVLLDMNR